MENTPSSVGPVEKHSQNSSASQGSAKWKEVTAALR